MTEAPEKIWAARGLYWLNSSRTYPAPVEYTRSDIAEGPKMLLREMEKHSPIFAAMVEAAEDTHAAGASFNRVIGNALRAAVQAHGEASDD